MMVIQDVPRFVCANVGLVQLVFSKVIGALESREQDMERRELWLEAESILKHEDDRFLARQAVVPMAPHHRPP
jgi:hypothetical protein